MAACLAPFCQVAVVLSGRYAGKKVVVIKQADDGHKERPYGHAIVAGVDRYPRKVTRNMGAKKLSRRSKLKPFIKVSFLPAIRIGICSKELGTAGANLALAVQQAINYKHLMPTRYALELEGLKGVVSNETFKEVCAALAREDSVVLGPTFAKGMPC